MAGRQNSFVWYELMTSDVAAANSFYGKVVGWNAEDVPMPSMTYTMLRIGDTQVGGLMPLPAEASNAGGRIMHGPQQVPGGGWIVQATDPQGAAFALFGGRQ